MDHFITPYGINQLVVQIMMISFLVYFLSVIGQALQTKCINTPICFAPFSWYELTDVSQLPFLIALGFAVLFITAFFICDRLGIFKKRVICPTCRMHGVKSTVQEGASWSTTAHYPDMYDERGRRAEATVIRMTTEYLCSNGHRFEQQRWKRQ